MTKKEIKAKLLSYGIEVTLRPRKATLLELLERVEKEHKAGRLTSKVTHMDDIYYACCDTEGNIYQDKPIEKIMEWLTLAGCTIFFGFLLLGVINFYTDIAIPHLVGLLAMFIMIFGIPLYVWYLERKYK